MGRLKIFAGQTRAKPGVCQAMARCNKCGSEFTREAPRGRRSIVRALEKPVACAWQPSSNPKPGTSPTHPHKKQNPGSGLCFPHNNKQQGLPMSRRTSLFTMATVAAAPYPNAAASPTALLSPVSSTSSATRRARPHPQNHQSIDPERVAPPRIMLERESFAFASRQIAVTNLASIRPSKEDRLSLNDINYHYATCQPLQNARNIINKTARNARKSRLSASYERFLLLNP
ncbi:hypothetical protein CCOS865_03180 [Pseudomonas reidholzensis]|uniref:Uncharacterized protein n=1 Tax=Pseudomonas reidholzensis TaxID=1785162 RepID=A0A383RV58_9PSED|nr:hypothetical protein CCOS865_03180 [Pseudomonas reidholzensis]